MKLLTALGLDYKILIAQLINFALLLVILYKIGYKPILKFTDERKKKIAKGLDDAKNAEEAYTNAKEQQTELIVHARKEAQKILEESKVVSEKQRQESLQKTKEEVQKVVEQSKKKIMAERDKMLSEIKSEVVEMVIESTQKVLQGAVDETVDRTWLKKQLEKVKS
jgi:F-type H+-transporting ATPase subunit b